MSGSRRAIAWVLCLVCALAAAAIYTIATELRTSRYQARYCSRVASELGFRTRPGPSTAVRYPAKGPYDLRFGYARMPQFFDRLTQNGFTIRSQARSSPTLLDLCDRGLYPIYREKSQGGLTLLDRHERSLLEFRAPSRVFATFDSVPDIIVRSLLFIENRELLDPRFPKKNPAVEWDRLAKAAFEGALNRIDRSRPVTGGSTLATQIEKFRHSSDGRTTDAREKIRQMVAASLRAYLDGEDTSGARRQIIVDYVNSLPLAASSGYGEVTGLGDGMQVWFGVDFDTVSCVLQRSPIDLDPAATAEFAEAYKHALSLLIAARRPSHYLQGGRSELDSLTNAYLRLSAAEGLISVRVRDAALVQPLRFRESLPRPDVAALGRKAADAIRAKALFLLGIDNLYELDRLDLTLRTTLDATVQAEVAEFLSTLNSPTFAEGAGLLVPSLLDRGDPGAVRYSLTLYERGGRENLLRVQADNLDQPFNVNENAKLELGSTAKLRTLVTYLEIVADLNARYGGLSADSLGSARSEAADPITRWAIEYFRNQQDRDLSAMLEAAMLRTYSASPNEDFFTGGGVHRFNNFDQADDGKVLAVRTAFRNSVNLVFIRLMRDIVRYYMFQIPGSSARILEDPSDASREVYLERFADHEGRQFIDRFLRKYRGRGPEEAIDLLLQSVRPVPRRLAMVFRTLQPDADFDAFVLFLKSRLAEAIPTEQECRRLYDAHAPDALSLADKGYLAGIHPLELWVVAYLSSHPDADRAGAMAASEHERREVYRWLLKTNRKKAQDTRLQTMLEVEAFLEIHRSWQRLGYPFDALVPSYATAIGSSGDRPAALSELLGIALNDGLRVPTRSVRELHFAEGTPYETVLVPAFDAAERVLAPEVAEVVRDELFGVVSDGTGRRAREALTLPGGGVIPVGGKTGTGNNRFQVYGAGGRLVESRPVNRVATFAFIVGDRFFGVITAYVEGSQSEDYQFTSALPAQLLRILGPTLLPLMIEGERLSFPASDSVEAAPSPRAEARFFTTRGPA
jgi:membrane peptidoglycan carboxypeptidase